MIISRRWNKFWIGLALSIVLPLLFFILVYFFGFSRSSFGEFMKYSFKIGVLPKILCLCVAIPDFAVFYLFLNKEYWYAARGVIAATLLYTLGFVVINFFV